MSRFFTISEDLDKATSILIEKDFKELDSCMNEEEELATHIFIDKAKKTFYHTDKECLAQTSLILLEKYRQSYRTTTLKKIKKWAYPQKLSQ